ncbi:sigma-54-dependent Fis family transcriptional regulator [Fulvivirga sp. 29W222]|uniref:Sigma-54-dependent Fis family transcriptional regulator n=1 Tax=Fulvivirga marina TaxID=2494733 RepID=A0A937G3I5_9BACT|nr:sigma-54 dependent transcriptional regulator [Fulvivirga marina]MBL6449758.1 sigma-54-dependent Fis family transcriptional regulator [Fulvivirga marina]
MASILIVEDDASFAAMLKGFLAKNKFECDHVSNGIMALRKLNEKSFDIILSDLKMPDLDGLDLLKEIKKKSHECAVIIMTNYAHIKSAVKAIKLGAFEYIAKPINPDELLSITYKALNAKSPKEERPIPITPNFEFVHGQSPDFQRIIQHVGLVAETDMSVLILGESGTGKEYIARLIHQKSKRKDKPFVSIDCGALSENLAASELFGHVKGAFTGAINDKDGQFQLANGGTLFLDEIGNLSYEVQVKLLRILQERKVRKVGGTKDFDVDVRLITATNESLSPTASSDNNFREDLFHRINEFQINIPALRQRKQDIEIYAQYFLGKANQELNRSVKGFSNEAMEVFLNYDWPGNIRELKNMVRRSVLLETEEYLGIDNLSELTSVESLAMTNKEHSQPKDLKTLAIQNEKALIAQTLKDVKFNKSKAARILKIDRSTLYNKIRKYELEV